jgi:phosphoribosylamine---glycine ligase
VRVLVIGGGAREHAIAWKFSKSRRIAGLFIAPGNAGTAEIGANLPELDPQNPEMVLRACRNNTINLVFVGPEAPLANGLVDVLTSAGIPVIGPGKTAAQLESSKAFAKRFMRKHDIPTPEATELKQPGELEHYLEDHSGTVVLKKSGLAAGKGVLESDDRQELMHFAKSVLEDDTLLAEEFVDGYEVSVFALTDGTDHVLLPPCADFKKAGPDDTGMNTGGMGSVCPVPWLDRETMATVEREIVEPTFRGLKKDGLMYKGVLYFGLMITGKGPRVLEFNVRLGDPETQALLPLVESDFGNLCDAIVNGTLATFPLRISDQAAAAVVIASPGYPGSYPKGLPVDPIPTFPRTENLMFHASTTRDAEGRVRTGGGRCFTVVGFGNSILRASVKSYEAVKQIRFEGAWYRPDIGRKFFVE